MKRYLSLFLMFFVMSLACNLPSNIPLTETPTEAPPAPAVPEEVQATETPAPINTSTSTPVPQNPLVLRDSLCWVGPGNKYDVVSALKTGTRIELIGRGTVDGWWVISNPIYKDACWVRAEDIQIEPGFDTSTLKLIDPPPLPTVTWTPSPTWTPGP